MVPRSVTCPGSLSLNRFSFLLLVLFLPRSLSQVVEPHCLEARERGSYLSSRSCIFKWHIISYYESRRMFSYSDEVKRRNEHDFVVHNI